MARNSMVISNKEELNDDRSRIFTINNLYSGIMIKNIKEATLLYLKEKI